MMSTFLDDDEVIKLTGRKMKGQQIDTLRKMGLPFFVNATGHAVVARSAIDGRKESKPQRTSWTSSIVKAF
ncbi:uncharacterized protein DUF4224 [Collimonas sp. PA-H2]|uniref:DUF4224 domain-containing protein n=1 Tax=Collimonas sp. PA-H2 TaxID=1881062 RepID=UPI000C00C72C|nr:DUF4224 domain-containing protein [Collimonas sp. PA-H2]PFH08134.1 uncharacterized protein DUF4224 [Collimonas sp. PA-H2]